MNKTIILLILLSLLLACTPVPKTNISNEKTPITTTPVITKTPIQIGQDYKPVRLIWFYKPPASGNLSNLVKNYDLFILTRQDEPERDELRELGVQSIIMQYLLFSEIQNPGSCTERPWHNQVAEKIGDFCNILKNHSDWFLWSSDGQLVTNNNSFKLMDPGNSEWRDFWLQRAKYSQDHLGWHGVFLDNVEASLQKRMDRGVLPKKYTTDTEYQNIIEDNLKYLYESYFLPSGIPLYANIISLKDMDVWFRYMQYLDGAMIENFAVGWSEGDETASEWESQISIAEATQAMGKVIILISQGEEFNANRQTFALASYLLVNYGNAYIRYTNHRNYDLHWWYDNYELDLGLPLGERYASGDAWVRDFTNGKVIVNPVTWEATIEVYNP